MKNYLAYKLGEAYLQENKLWKLPFVFIKIKKEYLAYLKLYQQMVDWGLLPPPLPLHCFADYLESLQVKQTLEFKLGEEVIKANKSFLKLGFLRFGLNAFRGKYKNNWSK